MLMGPYLKCGVCCGLINEAEYYDCISCDNRLHKACVYDSLNLQSSDPANLTCVCPECKCKKPRGDNSNTPVRPAPNLNHLNVTYRKDRNTDLNLDSSMEYGSAFDTAVILTELRQLRVAVNDLSLQNEELTLLRKEVTELRNQIAMMSVPSPTPENDNIIRLKNQEITDLRSSVADLQQQGLRNDIEIAGIPETENENIRQLVLTTATKIGVVLTESDIDGFHRAGPRRSPLPQSPSNPKNLPRPIVVKLVRRAKRDEIVRAAKDRKNVTSLDIVPGTNLDVYINERLTKANRLLFRSARQRALQHRFRFSWVRDGNIFVRKAEKMPAILIRSEADIDQKVGPFINPKATDFRPI